MGEELDKKVIDIQVAADKEQMSYLIDDYKPFILKVVTEAKKGYVDLDNDDEFSIALMAFKEAIERYDIKQGNFLSFASLVIRSRLKSYWSSTANKNHFELDEERDKEESFEDSVLLRLEIEAFEKSLEAFGITFDDLIDKVPKHQDTLDKAKEIGRKAAQDEEIIDFLYTKRRLPITLICEKYFISPKVVKRSKLLITSIIILVKEGYGNIFDWIS